MVKLIALYQIETGQNYFQEPVIPNCSFHHSGCYQQQYPKQGVNSVNYYCYLQSFSSTLPALIKLCKNKDSRFAKTANNSRKKTTESSQVGSGKLPSGA
ncbi:hypothetical protein [Lacibacter sp. H407]|uniref:hypothetical protein n=1 Tax=Lacibacter sp. H407 TaxID=3133423 RepID=UPI0030C21418